MLSYEISNNFTIETLNYLVQIQQDKNKKY